MQNYEFTVVLANCTGIDEDLANRLYSAGCDDGTAGSSEGIAWVVFERTANSLESAIRSAIGSVQNAGCSGARVEISPDAALLRS